MTNILRSSDGNYIPSYYSATANKLDDFTHLEGEIQADVCIVGGGYTGLSTAIHVAEQGKSVVLLEAEKVGWGASGRNGGHVGVGQRKSQSELESLFGLEKAKTFWQFGLEAVDLVAELITKHSIQCDLKKGILHVAAKESDVSYLEQDTALLINTYGYDKIRNVKKDELDEMVGSTRYYSGQLDSGSLHLHPLNYALGLAKAAADAGVQIFEHSRVTSFKPKKTAQDSLLIETDQGKVQANHMVIACNGYLDKLAPQIAGKIMPINNFVIATEPLGEDLARELIRDDVALQDSLFVINYWKLSGDNRLVFGGGENYTSRFPKDICSFVRKHMLRIYPQLADTKIEYGWGGTLAVTMNRMPHFGTYADDIYFAQGYSGHGVPTATFAGKLLSEAICGNPDRFNMYADLTTRTFPGGTLLRWPGLVAGMLYYTLLDKL
jgi:gamma-glutamylputrescine oxidase